jgi:predicted RNase H-like nuclease
VRVLGVDGCKGAWVAVALEDGALAGVRRVERIGDLIADAATVIGIDTPLGECAPGGREADRGARAFLSPRSGLVFAAPMFDALRFDDRERASAHSVEAGGQGIGSHAWGLRFYMRDARPHWCAEPGRIFEIHPECSFREMAGRPLASKKHWPGVRDRLSLLRAHGIDLLADPSELAVPAEDVLDAAAVAWSAQRVVLGVARSFPEPPERDDAGRDVAIWY